MNSSCGLNSSEAMARSTVSVFAFLLQTLFSSSHAKLKVERQNRRESKQRVNKESREIVLEKDTGHLSKWARAGEGLRCLVAFLGHRWTIISFF